MLPWGDLSRWAVVDAMHAHWQAARKTGIFMQLLTVYEVMLLQRTFKRGAPLGNWMEQLAEQFCGVVTTSALSPTEPILVSQTPGCCV